MKKLLLFIFLLSTTLTFSQSKDQQKAQFYLKAKGEITFAFKVNSPAELNVLATQMSIVNYNEKTKTVKAWANSNQFNAFLSKNIPFQVEALDNESRGVEMTSSINARANTLIFPLAAYPTYADYAQQMQDFATDNPGICELVDFGGTGEGAGGGNKRLLLIKLSDNIAIQENEPKMLYTSSMHGDEIAGFPMMLDLIDYFITAYKNTGHADHSRVKNLLDNSEVWINPMANPDGTYYNSASNTSVANARRGNANNIDLNRNYPDNVGGAHPDGQSYQTETTAFMNLADANNFVLSANFHGGIEVVNYPWDNTLDRHPDDAWFQLVSREYADNAQANSPNGYMDDLTNGITHGADWYRVEGGRQDYMNHDKHTKEVTIELSAIKTPAANQLVNHWNYNREALIDYLVQGMNGFTGVVKDAITGNPLEATVKIVGHDALGSWVITDAVHGGYHRPIKAGTYDIIYEAQCYQSFTLSAQTIADNQKINLTDVLLTPIGAVAPTGLAASNIGATTVTLNWDAANGATYDLRYRAVGATTWITNAETNSSSSLTGLTALTQYEAQIRSKCTGGANSPYSSLVNFTTIDVQLNYCASASTNVNDEYIGKVQLNTIDNTSGAKFYSDFTAQSTTLTKDTQYTITVTPTWTGTVYNEGYSVWIDYNRDGDFTDAGEQVWTQSRTKNTPVSGNFTVPTSAVESATRMRVSMKYNGVPTSCESFQYGEVEDYTVTIQGSGPDTETPTAPTSLIATNITQTTTDLSWTASTDNVGITAYDVYQGVTVIATVSGTTHQVTGLTASTNYAFSIIAKDAAGNTSIASNLVNITTLDPPDTEAPTAPTNLLAINTTQSSTDLLWTASTDNVGVTAYDVYQGASVIATVSGTTYQVAGLTASTLYAFSVRAKDTVGNESEASNSINVTTLDTEAPTAPSNLVAANTTQTTTDLSWTVSIDNVGVTAYDVHQGASVIATILETSYQVTGLTASTNYAFSVVAKDAAGNNSEASNVVNISTLDPPDTEAPTAPTNLIASNTSQTTTDLSWTEATDNVGITTYDVYQGASIIATVSGTTYQVTGLAASTNYSFNIIAKDAAENSSEASNSVNVTTDAFVDVEAPTTPTGLTASNTTQTTTDLSWTASIDNVGVTAYDVYQGTSIVATVSSTIYQVTGLTVSTNYAFTVIAKDAVGNSSSASNVANITTLDPPDTEGPTTPTNLVASNITQTTTDLSWTASIDNVGVTTYDVYQGASVVGTVSGTTYQVTGLTLNTAYTFSVIAKDAAGNTSATSNSVHITTSDTSGCTGGITVYPYNEGFENSIGAWPQSTADDIDWTVDTSGTPSSGTGPSSASEGSYYIYVEASGSAGFPTKRAIINSPCFDLGALTQATFGFKYHMYGSNDMGIIDLELSDDDGVTWTSIWSASGNKGNSWQTASVDISAYVGGSVQLRFNRVTGGTWQADIAIDDVSLTDGTPISTCNTGDVALSITFDDYPEETGWTLKDASGTTIDSATYSASNPDGSTTNKTFSGLAAGNYTFTITDVYGDGICCSYGNGSYTLTGSLGTIVTGGNFGSSAATEFCIESVAAKKIATSYKEDANDNADNLIVYPNPVRGDGLNVITTFKNVNYEVFNMVGQIVAKGKLTNKRIDISALNAAVYQIQFKTEDKTIVKRFIKE